MVRPYPLVARAVAVVTMILVGAACGGGSGAAGGSASEPAWSRLDSMDTAAFEAAWARLSGRSYERYVRYEQFDDRDRRTARREIVVRSRMGESPSVVVRGDSSGAFSYGAFDPVVSGKTAVPASVDMAPYVFPDEAPYLSPRNRDKYAIEVLPDTVLDGTTVHRIDIRAVAGDGDEEPIRHARFFVSADRERLVAAMLERIDPALLFTEQSRVYVQMQPDGQDLVPYLARYETWIRARVGRDRRFRLVSAWYDVGA